MSVLWRVAPGIRADLVAYGAPNFSGKRQAVQLFPTGSRKGQFKDTSIRSLVVRAPIGTRVVLAASSSDSWSIASWRCIRMLEGQVVPSEQRNGLPGVRIPQLDVLDPFDAKRTDREVESGVPKVDELADGVGWTFGHGGSIGGRVAMILVEREEADGLVRTPAERVAAAMLQRLEATHAGAVAVALDAALEQLAVELTGPDTERRLARFREEWDG